MGPGWRRRAVPCPDGTASPLLPHAGIDWGYLSYPLLFLFKIYKTPKVFGSLTIKPGFFIASQEEAPQICRHHWHQNWALKQNPQITCSSYSSLPQWYRQRLHWLHQSCDCTFSWLSATMVSCWSVTSTPYSQMRGCTMPYREEGGLLACLPFTWTTLNQWLCSFCCWLLS